MCDWFQYKLFKYTVASLGIPRPSVTHNVTSAGVIHTKTFLLHNSPDWQVTAALVASLLKPLLNVPEHDRLRTIDGLQLAPETGDT